MNRQVSEVSEESIAVAKASYERCRRHVDFFDAFYRSLFRLCPKVEPLFADTDFSWLHRRLDHAIGLLLAFAHEPVGEPTILTRVADRHAKRDIDVDPSLHKFFVESLIATIREYDPQCTAQVEQAWRVTVAPGVEYIASRYALEP